MAKVFINFGRISIHACDTIFRFLVGMGSLSDAERRCRVVVMMSNNNFRETKQVKFVHFCIVYRKLDK